MQAAIDRRKAKERAAGGPVVVTYRHLLSTQAMTVSNPLRVVAHCDIDAAYAQFEMVRLNIPPDQPLCVQQWSGLIAVNYPARKFGISRHMDVHEAKKKCPHLMTVHVATYREGDPEPGYWGEVDSKDHKVSLDPYRRESSKILAVFKRMVSVGEVEKASIDEAYLDLSLLTIQEILLRNPYLSSVPTNSPLGLDTPLPPPPPISWQEAGNIFPIGGEREREREEKGSGSGSVVADGDADGEGEGGGGQPAEGAEEGGREVEKPVQSYMEVEEENGDGYDDDEDGLGANGRWEDYALSIGAELMGRIRREVKTSLGYTCSAGISHNKTLAKLCSAWKKPDNQTVLRQAAIPAFLNPMQFTKIRFLGGKLGDAMAKEYDANTVGDMLKVPLDEMQRKFGEESIWVYNILRGIDHNPVKERTATKSMLASKNIDPAVTDRERGYHWLSVLAGELYVRLRDAREETEGVWPKTLVLGTRQVYESTRSRQTAFPFTRHLTPEYIAKFAHKLWDEVSEPMLRKTSSKSVAMKINNLGLSFANLERTEGGQKGIESFFANGTGPPALRGRKRSRSPSAGPSRSSSISNQAPKPKRQSSNATSDSPAVIDISDDEEEEEVEVPAAQPAAKEKLQYTCDRCKKRYSTAYTAESEAELQGAENKLEELKRDHADWHMAKDLYEDDRKTAHTTAPSAKKTKTADSTTKSTTTKLKAAKPGGIQAFFTPAGSTSAAGSKKGSKKG